MKLHCYQTPDMSNKKNFFFFFNHIFKKPTIYYLITINIPKKEYHQQIIIIFPDKYNKIKNLFYAFLTQYTVKILYRKFIRRQTQKIKTEFLDVFVLLSN